MTKETSNPRLISDPSANTLLLINTTINGLTNWFKAEIQRVDDRAMAETHRIDAIREVDATAVRVAADRALDTASTLASQVSSFNETQRALVNTTADVVAKNLQQVSNQISESAKEQTRQQQFKDDAFLASIAALQKSQNESQGRSGVSIPLLLALVGLIFGIIGAIVGPLISR